QRRLQQLNRSTIVFARRVESGEIVSRVLMAGRRFEYSFESCDCLIAAVSAHLQHAEISKNGCGVRIEPESLAIFLLSFFSHSSLIENSSQNRPRGGIAWLTGDGAPRSRFSLFK